MVTYLIPVVSATFPTQNTACNSYSVNSRLGQLLLLRYVRYVENYSDRQHWNSQRSNWTSFNTSKSSRWTFSINQLLLLKKLFTVLGHFASLSIRVNFNGEWTHMDFWMDHTWLKFNWEQYNNYFILRFYTIWFIFLLISVLILLHYQHVRLRQCVKNSRLKPT